MASSQQGLLEQDNTLSEALERESGYDWIGAARLYEIALTGKSGLSEPKRECEIIGMMARSRFRSAFQAETRQEFKRRMNMSISTYEKLTSNYKTHQSNVWSKIAESRGQFASFWMSEDFQEKKAALKSSIGLTEKAATEFEDLGDRDGLLAARQDLLTYYDEACSFSENNAAYMELLRKGLQTAEYLTDKFRELEMDDRLVETLYRFANLLWFDEAVEQGSRHEELRGKAASIAQEIREASARVGTPHALCLANFTAAIVAHSFEDQVLRALKSLEEAIPVAEGLKDSLLATQLYAIAAFECAFVEDYEESPGKRRAIFSKQIDYAKKAIHHGEISRSSPYLDISYWSWAYSNRALATRVETDPERKRAKLREAIEIARSGMSYNQYSPTRDVGNALSCALYELAQLTDDNSEEKLLLLKESLAVRKDVLRTGKLLLSDDAWNLGRDHFTLAMIKVETSRIQPEPQKKIELLEEATADMDECLRICSKSSPRRVVRDLGIFQEKYGDILIQLNMLSQSEGTVETAIGSYNNAILSASTLGLYEPIALLKWKIARGYDSIDNFGEASREFEEAAKSYQVAAKAIPISATVFEEYASYMAAWSSIERARLSHEKNQYAFAADRYSEAAQILEKTITWRHLADHYQGCSLIEQAEIASGMEKQENAVEIFTKAQRIFKENLSTLTSRLASNTVPEEKRELSEWINISRGREMLCQARIDLEQAKTLDKKGQVEACAEKYASAEKAFHDLRDMAPTERSRLELQALASFADGWAEMKNADLESSPKRFRKAAISFRNAAISAKQSRPRNLAMANASICDALERGMRFRQNNDVALYSDIKKDLESAASYYDAGGFESATEWTRATQRLFDALVYNLEAETERDANRKKELLILAEKYLDMSAKLYGVAGYPAKQKSVLKQLNIIHEQRELLPSPIEALQDNPAINRTVITPVSLTSDTAVGPERFEPAKVVGSFSLSTNEVRMGSEFLIELELVNIGKSVATLVRIEGLAAEGIEIDRAKHAQFSQDSSVTLGKSLGHLETHKERLWLKAGKEGQFELHPKLFYADEIGNYRTLEFPASHVSVTALANADPIRSPITEFLAKQFVHDYMVRRLSSEHSGWRSLTDLVEELDIPKAQIYGDSRYGHTFGKLLDGLVKAGIVEYRIVPGVRGRGGNAMKIRVAYDREPVKRVVDAMALKPFGNTEPQRD